MTPLPAAPLFSLARAALLPGGRIGSGSFDDPTAMVMLNEEEREHSKSTLPHRRTTSAIGSVIWN